MSREGYLGWEFPTNRLLQRLPLAKYSAFNIIMWGVVLSLFAVTENFAGAVVIRLFLGIFEAAVTPGFALFVSQVCLHAGQEYTDTDIGAVVYQKGTRLQDGHMVQFQRICMQLHNKFCPHHRC